MKYFNRLKSYLLTNAPLVLVIIFLLSASIYIDGFFTTLIKAFLFLIGILVYFVGKKLYNKLS